MKLGGMYADLYRLQFERDGSNITHKELLADPA